MIDDPIDYDVDDENDGLWPCSGKEGKCEARVEADGELCAECQADKDYYAGDYDICPDCNGSGEGQYEGQRCWHCKGKGTV